MIFSKKKCQRYFVFCGFVFVGRMLDVTIQEGHLELVKLLVTFSAQLTEGNRLGRRVSIPLQNDPILVQKYDSISKYNSHRMFVNICNYIKSHRSLTGQHCTWQLFQVIFRLFSGSSLKVLSFSKSFTKEHHGDHSILFIIFLFWINSIPESQISSTGLFSM